VTRRITREHARRFATAVARLPELLDELRRPSRRERRLDVIRETQLDAASLDTIRRWAEEILVPMQVKYEKLQAANSPLARRRRLLHRHVHRRIAAILDISSGPVGSRAEAKRQIYHRSGGGHSDGGPLGE
jgi:hypothetical protein